MDESLHGLVVLKRVENQFQNILLEAKTFIKNWIINESVSLHDEDDEDTKKVDLAGEDKGLPDDVVIKIHNINQTLNSTLAQALKEIEENLNPIKAKAYAQLAQVLKKYYDRKIREKLVPQTSPAPKPISDNTEIKEMAKKIIDSIGIYGLEGNAKGKAYVEEVAKDLTTKNNEFVEKVFNEIEYDDIDLYFYECFVENDKSLGTRNLKIFRFLLNRLFDIDLIKNLNEKSPHTKEFADFSDEVSARIERLKSEYADLRLEGCTEEIRSHPPIKIHKAEKESIAIKKEITLLTKKHFSNFLMEKKAEHPFAEILNNILHKNHNIKQYATILTESLKNNNFYAASLQALQQFKNMPSSKSLNEAYDDVNYGSPAFMKQIVDEMNNVLLNPLKKQHPELEDLINNLAAGVSKNLEKIKYINDPEHKPPVKHKNRIENLKKLLGFIFHGPQFDAISKNLDAGKPFSYADIQFILGRAKRVNRITEADLQEIKEVMQTFMK